MTIGKWMAAALDDPTVCAEMKHDIQAWFDAAEPPDPEAALAAETAIVQRFYYYFPADRKAVARELLRRFAKSDGILHDEDGMADVALEELWNILSGNC